MIYDIIINMKKEVDLDSIKNNKIRATIKIAIYSLIYVVCIFFVCLICYNAIKIQSTRHLYKPIEAEVVKVERVNLSLEELNSYNVYVNYNINEQEYSSIVSYGNDGDKLKKGEIITIYYHKDNPKKLLEDLKVYDFYLISLIPISIMLIMIIPICCDIKKIRRELKLQNIENKKYF